jgi:hormone-sensitive lipase
MSTNFSVFHLNNKIDINPKTILLAGDSAGGNLAAAVTGMAIKLGARVPDGLLLSYPGFIALLILI